MSKTTHTPGRIDGCRATYGPLFAVWYLGESGYWTCAEESYDEENANQAASRLRARQTRVVIVKRSPEVVYDSAAIAKAEGSA